MNKKLKNFIREEVFEEGEYTLNEVILNYFDLKKENSKLERNSDFDFLIAKEVVDDFIEIIDKNDSIYFNENEVYYELINFIRNDVCKYELIKDVFNSLKNNNNPETDVNEIVSFLISCSTEYEWDVYKITLDDLLLIDKKNFLFKKDPELIDILKTQSKISGLTRGDVIYKITEHAIKNENYLILNLLYEDYFDKNLRNLMIEHLEKKFNKEESDFSLNISELKTLHKYLKNDLNIFLDKIISTNSIKENVKIFYEKILKDLKDLNNGIEKKVDDKMNEMLKNKLKQIL